MPLTQTEKLNTLSTALFPPPEATDKHHHTIDNSVDVNLGAALYDLRRTGADASCIATIERVLGQLTVARRIVEAA